ncbi:MAG: aminoacyl-tRNA hydrolase, partial [Oscillospiraceae bacterium]|nr:aminoacyl-tRNA hydrolase [Oscillospiraceae bacterium]
IISQIGDVFPRIKLGVGEEPHPEYDLADWVLGKFSDADRKLLSEKFEGAYQSALLIIDGQTDKAMNLYNR